MNTKTVLAVVLLGTFILAGCQNSQPPEHALNTTGRPRVFEKAIDPADEILPVLKLTTAGETREMKLRSQTSRFLDVGKKSIEITLSSSRTAFCANENPELKEGEEQFIITVTSKDTAIIAGEASGQESIELSAIYKNSEGEKTFSQENFTHLNITDLNTAIARGNLSITSEDFTVEGEFFTAICR